VQILKGLWEEDYRSVDYEGLIYLAVQFPYILGRYSGYSGKIFWENVALFL
jgi:hypothetical protein